MRGGGKMKDGKVPWEKNISKNTKKQILELCNINPDKDNSQLKLLDFGCGNGRYLEVFAGYLDKQNLYGIETSIDRVNEVKEKGFNCLGLNSGEKIPYDNEFFDIVFSTNVIEHIPLKYYQEYLKETYRVLKKGGRLVIGTPNYPIKRLYDLPKAFTTRMFKYYLLDDPTHCHKLSIKKLEVDLKKYFDEVYLKPTYILFENQLRILKKPKIRKYLSVLGDKIIGYCLKK